MENKVSLRLAVALAVVLGTAIPARAQDAYLASGTAQTWKGVQPNAAAGFWLNQGPLSTGDTRNDLIIGAPGGPAVAGAVYVIFGGPQRTGDLVLSAADTVITSVEAGNRFGHSTAIGHVLGLESSGGSPNLVVGAPGASGNRGAVYLFTGAFAAGGPALTQANAVYTIIGAPGDLLGTSVATGDLDNDGRREIVIGAPGRDRVYIIKGSSALSGTLDLTGGTSNPNKRITSVGIGNVVTTGDLTGDGIDDLVIGAQSRNRAFLFSGATGAIPTASSGSFSSENDDDEGGAALRILDIDGDGLSDLAIGAPGVDGPLSDRDQSGAVNVFFSPVSIGPAQLIFYGAVAGLRAGSGLAAGGDTAGSASDLVILGTGGSSGSGQLDVYYGRRRESIGVLQPDGRRLVDFATPGEVSRRIFGDPALGPITSAETYEVVGESARDIVVGVAAAEAGAGKVFFMLAPPRLRVTPNSVALTVNEGGTATSGSPVQVLNASTASIGWRTAVNQTWLSTNPTSGTADQTHPSQFDVVAASAGLAYGVHSGTVTVTSTSPYPSVPLPVDVTLTVTAARITIDTPLEGAIVSNGFPVAGWAIDLAGPAGTGVSEVHVYAYPLSGPPVFLGVSTYGGARSDVGALYGARFTNSGYSLVVSNLIPGAAYQISAFAKSTLTGAFANSASVNVVVSPDSAPPGDTPTDPNLTPPPDPTPNPVLCGATTPTAGTGLSINRSSLTFGALAGTDATKTGTQSVIVNFATGSPSWTAAANVPWLEITPAVGTGPRAFSVSIKAGAYAAGAVMTGTITVTAPGVTNSPRTLPVTLRVTASGGQPFGAVDSPANNATGVVGAIPVTGWALDDIGIAQVTLWRDPVAGETSSAPNGKIFIGTAVQVEGARSDVDDAYDLPFDYKAGWGYLLLTNMLPAQGNGTFVLQMYAQDSDGHTVLLGSRTITSTNAAAARPFGSIDTPDQGGSVLGANYTNFGWALTPQPNTIPFDGSTIMVFIDGVPVGRPTYNQYRVDIATLFPGRTNSNGAVGFYQFDTSALSNGVHTIAWSVADNAGNAEGIGSRYFTVLNCAVSSPVSSSVSSSITVEATSSVHTLMGLGAEVREAARTGAAAGAAAATLDAVPVTATPAYIRSGFDPGAPLDLVETDARGITTVTATEMSRFELTLGAPVVGEGDGYEGYVVANGRLEPLPAGAFLDRKMGQFFWQPGVGFTGTYELMFVRVSGSARERIPVEVRIGERRKATETGRAPR